MNNALQIVTEEVTSEVVVETKVKQTLKRNSLGQFCRKLERVVVPHGQTYNVGSNRTKAALSVIKKAAKRERRAAKRLGL